MARRSEHSLEEIKEMVLKAAETIVVEEGFTALKVRKVAMEIGYTVGSIYMVFTNMGDLIMHVKARTLDDLAMQLDQMVCSEDAAQAVVELALNYQDFASHNFNRWSMIFEHRLPDHVEIPQWYQHKVDGMFSRVEDLLSRLQPDCPEQDMQRAARALWSGVHGICILSLSGKSDVIGVKDVQSNVVLLVENFIRGWINSTKG